jgi:hypothetical protein
MSCVIDSCFFNSIVWQKGAQIAGYYSFQIIGSHTPEDSLDRGIFVKVPKIDYPDSLLKLYYKNKGMK